MIRSWNETAVKNATLVEVRARRVGGAFLGSMEVRQARLSSMALRWLVSFSRARNGRNSAEAAGELMDAANEAGNAVRKREETHKMAEASRLSLPLLISGKPATTLWLSRRL